MFVAVSMSALMFSAGISSGPAAFPFFRDMMAFLISDLEGLLQLMSRSSSAGCMSGGVSGASRLSNSRKCSAHLVLLFGCSQLVPVLVSHWFFLFASFFVIM